MCVKFLLKYFLISLCEKPRDRNFRRQHHYGSRDRVRMTRPMAACEEPFRHDVVQNPHFSPLKEFAKCCLDLYGWHVLQTGFLAEIWFIGRGGRWAPAVTHSSCEKTTRETNSPGFTSTCSLSFSTFAVHCQQLKRHSFFPRSSGKHLFWKSEWSVQKTDHSKFGGLSSLIQLFPVVVIEQYAVASRSHYAASRVMYGTSAGDVQRALMNEKNKK